MASIFREVKQLLYTPIPLPFYLKFLDVQIPLPGFMERSTTSNRRVRRVARSSSYRQATSTENKGTGQQSRRESRERALEGVLLAGKTSRWALSGYDLIINPDTWVFGELKEGVPVKVKGAPFQGNRFLCSSVIVKGPGYTSSTGIPRQ